MAGFFYAKKPAVFKRAINFFLCIPQSFLLALFMAILYYMP